jgi:hypothetical protein
VAWLKALKQSNICKGFVGLCLSHLHLNNKYREYV